MEEIVYQPKIKATMYLLVCKTREGLRFVGATEHLKVRIRTHHADYHKHPDNKLYQTIYQNGGFDNWLFIKLYDFECENKTELKYREQRAIHKYNSTLNTYQLFHPIG